MAKNHTKAKFSKLGLLYILALSGIAGVIITTQVLIQRSINKQKDDSRVINIAGRQRMLSQKISKTVLKINNAVSSEALDELRAELQFDLNRWTVSHDGLLNGNDSLGIKGKNSAEVNKMFEEISPHYQEMVTNIRKIIKLLNTSSHELNIIKPYTDKILFHESGFLKIMDKIVFQYDHEANEKVLKLKNSEVNLLLISLAIILFEVLFIFVPTSKNVRNTVMELMVSENSAKKMAREIEVLYGTLEKSYQQLADVDIVPEAPTVFLKTDLLGNIYYFSDHLQRLLGFEENEIPINLYSWFEKEGYGREFLDGVMDLTTAGTSWNGEIKLNTTEGDFLWLDMHILPVWTEEGEKQEISVICRDVTQIKEARERSAEINREKIEKQVKERQYRSVLILEGQEEERKRIARDIHDGIGQMLIALKLNLESTLSLNSQQTKSRIQECREMLKKITREVRRVSFNLTPSSLNDFGLSPTIKRFCKEVGELMSIQIIFENQTRFINRMDTNVETHLYRIIQEAVNNAIKYSSGSQIKVIFSHNVNNLRIEIKDDGKGFDYQKLNESGHFAESGHGIFNMKERAGFINAGFEIDTAPGKGTHIKINLPLNQ